MIDLLSLSALVVAGGGLAGLGAWALHRPDVELGWREVRFPADLASAQVETLLDVVAGLSDPVVFVIDSQAHAMRFLLGAPVGALATITRALSGIAPQVRLDAVDAPNDEQLTSAGRVIWSGRWPLLRRDAADLSVAGLLGALSGLGTGERVMLVVRLDRVGRLAAPRDARGHRGGAQRHELPRDQQRAVRAKLAEPLLRAKLTVATNAAPEPRARQLMQRVIAILRTRSGVRGTLHVRFLGRTATIRAFNARRRFFDASRGSTVLAAGELVGLVGWPIAAPAVAGISYGIGPRLLPPSNLPTVGRVFGRSTWPGQENRGLAQPLAGALQHTAIVGGTGSGKSTLICSLVEQDMRAGRGCLVVDVKGDLVSDLLERVPAHRIRDVILLDPAASEPQPGLRLFPRGQDIELTADLIIGTLRELWPDTFGVRSAQYLRLGLSTLGHVPGATLVDLPFLFTDTAFRRQAVARVSDPLLRASWQRFEGLSDADKAVQIASPMSKLEELVGRSRLRVVLGQSQPRLAFSEVLARGRIVFVRLPPGLLGQPATRPLSALVLWQFFASVEARAALPPAKRHVFNAYVDEVAALRSVGLPLGDLLERARGLGVGLLLAPQSLARLSPELRQILLANVGSLAAFRLSASEAKLVAAELPGVTAEQLAHLDRFEIALRLALGPGALTPTTTATTPAPSRAISDGAQVRALAAKQWGQTIEQVDAALAIRLGLTPSADDVSLDDEPASFGSEQGVGTRRRSS